MVAALSVAEKLAVIQMSLASEDAGLLRRAGGLARRGAESLATRVEAFDRLVGKGIPRGSLVEADRGRWPIGGVRFHHATSSRKPVTPW